jgi:V/A-type H+-transporting ATPase subunit I
MFGIMFGDLGHGLVLAAIGLLLASRLVPQLSKQAGIGLILIACGLSSSVFGLLYGSFFGMEGVIPHLWLKPMHDILTLLMASVVLGVVILNIGFGCRLFAAARQGHFVEAIFDKNGLVGLLLYWGLVAIVLLIATGGAIPEWLFVEVMLCVFALFFSEPLTRLLEGKRPLVQGSALELGVQAFFELFEALISYISNTLSYVRLGAFAVAHAGLSTVVFLLADMIGSGSSGSVGRAAVIVFGNIFVIGFEGLIVAIQTLRLEYYEFFGKFFKGDGIPFRPLSLPSVECRVQELERSKP